MAGLSAQGSTHGTQILINIYTKHSLPLQTLFFQFQGVHKTTNFYNVLDLI